LLALVGVVAFVGLFGMAKINDTLKSLWMEARRK